MSSTPGPAPTLALKCSNCGRENPPGRLFCRFCGHRIAAPPPEPEPDSKEQSTASGEAQALQASLQAAQDQNQNLHQQLESLKQELNKVKVANANPASSSGAVAELYAKLKSAEQNVAALQSQSAAWEKKWQSAENKAAALEARLAGEAKDFEAAVKAHIAQNPESNQRQRMVQIIGALAILGALGAGYAVGRYSRPSDNQTPKMTELSAQLVKDKEQINNLNSQLSSANRNVNETQNGLKSQLDSANQKITDLTNTLTARDKQQRTAERTLARAQQDLSSTQTRLNAALQSQHSAEELMAQRLAQQQTASARVQQLEADIQSRDNELSSLRRQLASTSRPSPRRSGVVLWSGVVTGKRRIDIRDGYANYGSVTGTLPEVPCTVSISSATTVQVKSLPAQNNHWNRVSFDVSGTGPVQVRINWVASQ